MKIATNKISSVIKFFKEELKGIYPETEIQSFIYLAFEHYLGFSKHDLVLKADNHISESELLQFNFVVKDLKKHKPIQYILGEMEFYGLKFKVNSSVLIPRPETEELVDEIVKIHKEEKGLSVMDICTGSGCIAIALEKNLTQSVVDALDISEEALKVARDNALLNNSTVKFIHSDILKKTQFPGKEYDIIVSNPPYVTESEKAGMQKNVLEYEPSLALFVDDSEPLKFYIAIAEWSKKYLKKGGHLYFEINEAKGEKLMEKLNNLEFKNLALKKDMWNKHRIIACSL